MLDAAVDRVALRGGLRPRGAAFAAMYESPRPRKLDYLSFDHYDPVVGRFARPARGEAKKLRTRTGAADLWEHVQSAASFAVFLRQAHLQAPDRPILVAENGLCTPGLHVRPDGVRRDDFLRVMTAEVLRARDEGVPVCGYIHWTLADNYEWGSYMPRFGLFGVDRADGVRIMDTDAIGVDAPGAFRAIVEADQSAERTGASAL
jgi:beta-glucosidase/6-phospho-beta-glucosidase/beta-galactosidase